MKSKQNLMRFGLVLAGVITLLMPSQVMAAGTASGTNITNSATLDYQVSGGDQTQINSNTTTFVVYNKVDLTVAEVGSANVVRHTRPNVAIAWDRPTSSLVAGNTRFVIERQFDYPVTPIRIGCDVIGFEHQQIDRVLGEQEAAGNTP